MRAHRYAAAATVPLTGIGKPEPMVGPVAIGTCAQGMLNVRSALTVTTLTTLRYHRGRLLRPQIHCDLRRL